MRKGALIWRVFYSTVEHEYTPKGFLGLEQEASDAVAPLPDDHIAYVMLFQTHASWGAPVPWIIPQN